MNKRIGPPLPVKGGAPGAHKPHLFIEPDCLRILLIDIGCHGGMKRKTMTHKRRTNALAPTSRIDKQRLHMAVIHQHETQRIIMRVNRKPQRRFGQKSANKIVNRKTILGRKEIMGGIDSAPPDFNNAIPLTGSGSSDIHHRGTLIPYAPHHKQTFGATYIFNIINTCCDN
jgi:hypothetical protein